MKIHCQLIHLKSYNLDIFAIISYKTINNLLFLHLI